MQTISPFPSSIVHTYSDPLTYISIIWHLSRPKSLKPILISRHNLSNPEAKIIAAEASEYISQGISLYHDSLQSSKVSRPILQYYSYLNLATACILCHSPKTAKPNYRRHGVSDITHSLDTLELNSRVIKVSKGALSEFHNIFSQQSISGVKFRLIDLLLNIQILESHLRSSHKVSPQRLCISDSFYSPPPMHTFTKHKVDFRLYTSRATNKYKRFPRAKIESCFPFLGTNYMLARSDNAGITYYSCKNYSLDAQHDPPDEIYEISMCINDFARLLPEHMEIGTTWSISKYSQMIPCLTASMLLSFSLASIYRYRPMLSHKLPSSRLAVLLDSFIDESPFVMLPTFRSLLYREFLTVKRRTMSN